MSGPTEKARVGMIHQPHFLPWPGYVARCLAADVFVALDNVQFKRNHFQHRTKFISVEGKQRWLSLPVARRSRSEAISSVEIAPSFDLARWQRPLREAYWRSPEFRATWAAISALISHEVPSLAAVNVATLTFLLNLLAEVSGRRSPVVALGSSIGSSSSRTERLIDICHDQSITHLIMGRDAMAGHACDQMRAAGIALVQHVYRGAPNAAPVAGVTILHEIFQRGVAATAARLATEWQLLSVPDASA